VHSICATSNFSFILNGRFKGGYITRHFGQPEQRAHAVQMELAMRGYLREQPGEISEATWPPPFEPTYAAPIRNVLRDVLERCISFALKQA
jgi:formiminoglutamase